MSQVAVPIAIALIVVFAWQRKLVGAQSHWVAYPLALVSAGAVAALISIGQFWLPQIQMGLGLKGLPLVVFGIVGARGAVPTMAFTAVILMGLGCIKLWRQTRQHNGA